jgi:hypothetical protein
MSFRRVGWIATIALVSLLEISCGQVYRPVVIPTDTTPPNPANFHAVFGMSANPPANQGTALQIDVSGDTDIGSANMGINPTHMAILPNDSRVFVASAGSFVPSGSSLPAGVDIVTAFTPAAQASTVTGLGNPITFTLPNLGPLDSLGFPAWTCSYLPDFVTTTQLSAVFVANYGVENDANCAPYPVSTDSIASLNTSLNTISNIAYLPAGSHPIALAETPNAQNLYVLNQGTNNILDLSPVDLTTLATIALPAGSTTPTWAVSSIDGLRMFVVTQGDGQLQTIQTTTNQISSTQFVGGSGANFVLYDKSLNRLYVTNPTAGAVYIFDATTDPPTPLTTISMTGGTNPPCPNGCSPVSVAALPDGSRFYVASYETDPVCPDPSVGVSIQCMIPRLTVFDARTFSVKTVSSSLLSPSISLLSSPQFGATQYGVPIVSTCEAPATYTPGSTRFRMFTAAAEDGSHVYVSICDAGTIADISTNITSVAIGSDTPDTLVLDVQTPFGVCEAVSCSSLASITGYSITSNVVTFQAANNFIPGQIVRISGLTSTTGALIDGLDLTVLGTGLSNSQFECDFNNSGAAVTLTPDAGSAVPQPPTQSPTFLLTGQ